MHLLILLIEFSEEYDDYDRKFDKMMELKLQDRQVKAKEDHAKAKKAVDDCRQNLEYAKQQVRKI